MPSRWTENLVIGGGLAGSAAAMRLAAAGREVTLLERERASHHKVCGEFLSPEAADYLRRAGVDSVAHGAVAIEHLRLSAKSCVVESTLPFRALSLSRRVVDEALLGRAAQAGCALRRGVAVERLNRAADGWVVECAGGEALQAKDVFLATGKHDLRGWSRGAGQHGDLVGFKMYWRLAPAQTEALQNCIELFLFTGGYGGLSLVEENAANLCFVVGRARLRRLGGWKQLLAGLISENRQIKLRLEGAEALWQRPLAISSIPYGYLAEESDGLWRIGDQAAVIPSFTGDGMSIALHSGELAAAMFLNGESPENFQHELSGQLRKGMRLATVLSRAMVTRIARDLAPLALAVGPDAITWIANSTRIPGQALLRTGPDGAMIRGASAQPID